MNQSLKNGASAPEVKSGSNSYMFSDLFSSISQLVSGTYNETYENKDALDDKGNQINPNPNPNPNSTSSQSKTKRNDACIKSWRNGTSKGGDHQDIFAMYELLLGNMEKDVLTVAITSVIEGIVNKNEQPTKKFPVSRFSSVKVPTIGISAYVKRIVKYVTCTKQCYILALIYLDRILATQDECLHLLNVHRILITSVLVAVKVFDDKLYDNSFFAKVGGINSKELFLLEIEFLEKINYQLFVTADQFQEHCKLLVHKYSSSNSDYNELLSIASQKVNINSWFTGLECGTAARNRLKQSSSSQRSDDEKNKDNGSDSSSSNGDGGEAAPKGVLGDNLSSIFNHFVA